MIRQTSKQPLFRLVDQHEVDFTAKSLHVDSSGLVWAYLFNGMVCTFDRSSKVITDQFAGKRFHEPFWLGNITYQSDFEGRLFRVSGGPADHLCSMQGISSPIVVSESTNECFYSNNGIVHQVSLDTKTVNQYRVGFDVGCMSFGTDDTLWVGGEKVALIDLQEQSFNLLDTTCRATYLSADYNAGSSLMALAGGGLDIFKTDGSLSIRLDVPALSCQFNKQGILLADGRQSGASDTLELEEIDGFKLCTVFGRGFHAFEQNNRSMAIVSHDSTLLLYELM